MTTTKGISKKKDSNILKKRVREKEGFTYHSDKNPFTATLNKFIKHHTNVVQSKPTDVKTEELSGVSGTQLQANKCWRRMFESWIFYLLGNLIWEIKLAIHDLACIEHREIDTHL